MTPFIQSFYLNPSRLFVSQIRGLLTLMIGMTGSLTTLAQAPVVTALSPTRNVRSAATTTDVHLQPEPDSYQRPS
ncbi:hypothetical protein [Fibrisoma limi]|uniref:hypothetical protein n=1 Tax=Fibrisoma limi TaxID=663275 RepID=UPI00118195B6|nr:hypothetical protein [Fibrisoma limi]